MATENWNTNVWEIKTFSKLVFIKIGIPQQWGIYIYINITNANKCKVQYKITYATLWSNA